ncbi:MAG: PBP1A family penicillin-binding protein [Clostridia bacterium]|nr:PBP1A family penicillin-binding protein [Clostridia bacterium]
MDPKAKAVSKPAKKAKQRTPAVKFMITVAKILTVFFLALSCAIAGIVGGAVFGYIRTAPPISDEQFKISILTTSVYDINDKEIAQLKGSENKNRILVKYDQTPKYLRDAFVALEDERFYKHSGVDLKRTFGAGLSFITHAGNAQYGGSTITQQVIKNITGETKVSPQRKVQEQWRALQLEKQLEKWQILELYMNLIYVGENLYGVQAASKAYFNKDVWDLSLAECASLAGITNSPGLFNPLTEKGRERNIKRQKIALQKMLELGFITQQEYDQALSQKLVFNTNYRKTVKESSKQSYFVDQVVLDVKRDLMAKGYSEDLALKTIYNYGLKIYTTQDSNVQNAMDEVFTNVEYFPANKKITDPERQIQSAMVIIDPKTGQVRALYGGYGKKNASLTLNRATQMERSPGSTFKPIADYGPALDAGLITPATIVDDVPVYMDTQNKSKPYPTNYESGKYLGLLSIHDAVKHSQNVVAAKVWRDILGPDLSIEYLKKVGINRENEKNVSLALGGLHKGVNPLIMAASYVPFVNKGMYYEPITYTRVENRDGEVILEKKPMQKKNIAYKESAAYVMTNIMKSVVTSGTAYPYGIIKNKSGQVIPTAGKTGTSSSFKDKWFVGFSPYYVGATWAGFDNNKSLRGNDYQALKVWHEVMQRVHKNMEPQNFSEPDGIVKKAICIYSGKTPTDLCYRDPRGSAVRTEVFVKGTEPGDDDKCDVHITASVCKDSKDIYGRNLVFGPSCPTTSLLQKVFIVRKEPYMPARPGDPYPQDWKLELPAGEYCTVHGN